MTAAERSVAKVLRGIALLEGGKGLLVNSGIVGILVWALIRTPSVNESA